VSWQLGAFVVLAVGLVGGFAWYERTRPDARTVALVGTLAAFGALGRIAFAAIPNVKPTTDIVLIAGFALGAAPGYVVGALAALSSNFFFGQGPWTPWQMAGWGLVGLLGALLARVSRGRIGRWPLAILCFPIGFAYTALQDCGDWVTYSDHSLAQLGVYVGKGVGFDLVHAAGCAGFALAFGPALIRALTRFRQRLEVTWLPTGSGGAALGAALVVALAVGLTAASPPPAQASTAHPGPLQYLRSAQNRDGGFGAARGQGSSPLYTAWALMAGAGGQRAAAYLSRTLGSHPGAGSLERTILALHAAGVEVIARPSLETLLERDIARSGSVSDQSNLTAFAILALRAVGVRVPRTSIAWLARQQDADGGFNYSTRGAVSDVDDTGAVLEALTGTGHGAVVRRAVRFIRAQQNADGGFPADAGGPSNAQSTAFAVQGLIAAGLDIADVRRHGSPTPLEYLRDLIQPNGSVDYARGAAQTPVWVTAQAQLALAGTVL